VLCRARRRLAPTVIVLAAIGSVALHHGVPMDTHQMPAAAMCLAVLGASVAVAKTAGPSLMPRLALAVDRLVPVAWLSAPRSLRARRAALG
jgi:hypothetical protein